MVGRYSAYGEYSNTYIEWIGSIPSHWRIEKFKYLFRVSLEKNGFQPIGEMLSVSGYRGIEVKQYDDEGRKRTDDELVDYRVVRKGQLVVNTMWLNYAGLGVSDLEGHVSPAYRSYWITDELDKRFCHHLLRSADYVAGYTKYMQGIRPNSLQIKSDDFNSFPVLVPSLEEQQSIARFLDHETAKIDELITKQERLIELLKEKRQTVISHAVTKGLNPDVPMKDSGVEWLGEVPEHWSVVKVAHCARVQNGSTPSKAISEYWENGSIPWLPSSSLNEYEVECATEFISTKAFAESSLCMIQAYSVLVGLVGQGRTRGMSALLKFPSAINQNMAAVTPYRWFEPKYLHHLFDVMYDDLRELGRGANQPALNCEILLALRVPAPSFEEQKAIVEYIEHNNLVLSEISKNALNMTELLRERRTALISAAVTGKIDVRNWKPEEAV